MSLSSVRLRCNEHHARGQSEVNERTSNIDELSCAEISDLDAPGIVEQQIFWFQIAAGCVEPLQHALR